MLPTPLRSLPAKFKGKKGKMKKSTKKKSDKISFPLHVKTRYPSPIVENQQKINDKEKIDFIAKRYREIMEVLGLDLSDDSLQKTPERIAKMYVKEIFSGLDHNTFPEISFFENKMRSSKNEASDLVIVKVNFTSFCEHHFVPMSGYAYVAYVPHNKLIGLSKIPRIVRFFAKRPQVQERLAAQIVDSLSILLETENVAISMIAEHYCVIARGIENEHSNTVTNILRGKFQTHDSLRREFFEGIKRQDKTV
jgi:GTP cyclohydrolase IA